MPVGRSRQPPAQVLDDRVAVDRIRQRLPHADISQRSVLEVEADVLIVHPRRLDDLQLRIASQLVNDVRSQTSLTTMSIVPFFSSSPRITSSGTILSTRPLVPRGAGPVVRVGRELDAIVDGVPDEADTALCRSDAPADPGRRPFGTIGSDQVDRKRFERLAEPEDDRVGIASASTDASSR